MILSESDYLEMSRNGLFFVLEYRITFVFYGKTFVYLTDNFNAGMEMIKSVKIIGATFAVLSKGVMFSNLDDVNPSKN
jgi:hypothetical protein